MLQVCRCERSGREVPCYGTQKVVVVEAYFYLFLFLCLWVEGGGCGDLVRVFE